MEVDFLLRARRLLAEREPARLDFAVLKAALAAQRSAGGKETSARPLAAAGCKAGEEALVELLLAGPDWRRAANAQGGCFSRAEAGRLVNDP